MTLESGKEMDRRCVLNWLNEVYVTPSRAFDEYTEDELKMFAHDALILLLKEQEPRVLTLEEVQNNCPDYVYLERATGWLRCCVNSECVNKYVGFFVYEIDKCFAGSWKEYGKMWRCWNYRPTEEQRKAVKWK